MGKYVNSSLSGLCKGIEKYGRCNCKCTFPMICGRGATSKWQSEILERDVFAVPTINFLPFALREIITIQFQNPSLARSEAPKKKKKISREEKKPVQKNRTNFKTKFTLKPTFLKTCFRTRWAAERYQNDHRSLSAF